MITRHKYRAKAYRDREFWFKQGYAVGILHPAEGDEWYTVYVVLVEIRTAYDIYHKRRG